AASWDGPLAPGASVLCIGTLSLSAPQTHADRAAVHAVATVTLTGGEVVTTPLSDTDDFHAATPTESGVDLTKRDEASGAEADTVDEALIVPADTRRVVEMPMRNTGVVPLWRVEVSDITQAGPALANLQCTFPNGDVVHADADGVIRWAASFEEPDVVWLPGVEFLCIGELTI